MADPLTPANAEALWLWNLLGGYHLERLPALAGFVTVQDWEATVDRLRCIRDTLSEEV